MNKNRRYENITSNENKEENETYILRLNDYPQADGIILPIGPD